MPTTSEYLKQYGFDPRAESLRLGSLTLEEQQPIFKQNILAYKNEVVEDKAVSIPYHYYFNSRGEIFTDPSLKPIFNLELQIDRRERQGLPLTGLNRALELARNKPNQLIALYSPEGPATFNDDTNNPFNGINYDYGQLYLMYYSQEKVKALAIKIKDEGKDWLEELLITKFKEADKPDFEEIKAFIQTPVELMPVDEFYLKQWRKDYLIYQNKKRKYYLSETIDAIKKRLTESDASDRFKNYEEIAVGGGRSLRDFDPMAEITEENIFHAYLSVIQRYLSQNGEHETVLSGSCGGSVVTIDRVEMILGIKNTLNNNPFPQIISGFSSVLRSFFKLDTNTWTERNCISCGKRTMVGGCGWCKDCVHEAEARAEKSKYN